MIIRSIQLIMRIVLTFLLRGPALKSLPARCTAQGKLAWSDRDCVLVAFNKNWFQEKRDNVRTPCSTAAHWPSTSSTLTACMRTARTHQHTIAL